MHDLGCHTKAPDTLIVPILFPKFHDDDFGVVGKEVANCKPLFTAAVTVTALEMVACVARERAEEFESKELGTQILATAFLNVFLHRLRHFTTTAIREACASIHELWGYPRI